VGIPEKTRKHAGDYVPTSPSLFRRIVRQSGVDPKQFTFIDLGCGKGRVLIAAADYPFLEIVGVELDSHLYETATDNLQRFRRTGAISPVRIVQADARFADLPSGNLFIFMYSPFRGPIFDHVAKRLAKIATDGDRAVVIAYSSDWEADALERTGAFTRVCMRRRQFWAPPTISFFYNEAAEQMYRHRQ
jgi:SAM-dependent methyltransferase